MQYAQTKFMKNIILILLLIAGVSCSKNDPQPAAPTYTSLIGGWKFDGDGILFKDGVSTSNSAHITVTFDIFADSLHPKSDTLYIRHGSVTYNGKSSLQLSKFFPKRVIKNVDGTYDINVDTLIPIIYNGSPNYSENRTYFASCKVNSSFTQMNGLPADLTNYLSGSWCSVMQYDGTPDDYEIGITSSIIIKRTK